MIKHLFFIALFAFGLSLQAGEKIITTSDGVKLYVNVKGEGLPLLYIHGGPGSGSKWFEEFSGDFMEQHFTIIYLDQRGVGRSGSPEDGNYSMDRMVQDFEEVREALGISSWLTLGHSFGGILQMGYAERFPEAHKGMLMVNCTLDLLQSSCESWLPKAAEILGETFSCKDTVAMPWEMMNHYGNRLREKNLFWQMAYADPGNEEIMNKTYESISNFNYDLGNAVMNNEEYFENYKILASGIEFPVLYFYGSKDWMVGPDHYKNLQFPNLLLWESEVGHMPFLEAKEDLQEAILTYKLHNGF